MHKLGDKYLFLTDHIFTPILKRKCLTSPSFPHVCQFLHKLPPCRVQAKLFCSHLRPSLHFHVSCFSSSVLSFSSQFLRRRDLLAWRQREAQARLEDGVCEASVEAKAWLGSPLPHCQPRPWGGVPETLESRKEARRGSTNLFVRKLKDSWRLPPAFSQWQFSDSADILSSRPDQNVALESSKLMEVEPQPLPISTEPILELHREQEACEGTKRNLRELGLEGTAKT